MRATEGKTATDAATDALLAGLNPAQLEAVTHPGGGLLIVAGPGSGKTRVITRRIAWLVRERGVDPRRILAITFTNKAAGEMRERAAALLPGANGTWISTFHAMGARILRQEIGVLGGWTRDFTIYDTGERQTLLKRAIQEAGFDPTRFKPAVVGAWISAKKNGARADESGEDEDGDVGLQAEVLSKVGAAYERALRTANALDFDDLLVKLLELFERHPGVRDAWAERFQHLLVDEYQDTNLVQYRLVRHLGSRHQNVTVCGDPDQSIYAWRGADIRNILEFEHDFPGCKVVLLEQNYRSVEAVLRAAQAVIERNARRKPKGLWSARGQGQPIEVLQSEDEEHEAERIATEIGALVRGGLRYKDIAVFYRVSFLQRALETGLRLARIPYQVVAGLEFYQRREIKDLVAWARLAVNPRDDVAFGRVINVPARGVGAKTIGDLQELARLRGLPLLAAASSESGRALARGRARAGLDVAVAHARALTELASLPAGTALRGILESIDRDAWLAEMRGAEEVDRDANLNELIAHADAWDERATERRAAGEDARVGLAGFLEEIALVSDADAHDGAADRVALMTLHAAKGLEFPAVFVCGVEEEILPHVRAIQSVDEAVPEAGIEEERRLFYVGLTRAADRLFLTHARSRRQFGAWSQREPSRFLEEIPSTLLAAAPQAEDEATALGAYAPNPTVPELALGDRVEHGHFGTGTVESLQGSGVNARAQVRFPAYGTKMLLLQYANLRRVGRASR